MGNIATTPGQRPATLTYTVDRRGKHRWCVKSSNGKTVAASSQGYATLVDAQKNLMLLGSLVGGYNGGYGDRMFMSSDSRTVLLWA